ncbi:hypothetical protein [Symbiopectobacterium purcellii]|uniref:hypothetical protein n=1 Tax=Symbiopectobacterium purcellii TaxID=2871826 RepID=UPI003F83AC70
MLTKEDVNQTVKLFNKAVFALRNNFIAEMALLNKSNFQGIAGSKHYSQAT